MVASSVKLVHYLNQFFAGIGGDEEADVGPSITEGPLGPGRLLQRLLGDRGEVVATVVCGDNFISGMPGFDESHLRQAIGVFEEALEKYRPDVVVAGPAFLEGRYGIGCGEVCKAARLTGVPALTAMHPDNVAVPMYVQDTYIVPTGGSAGEMPSVMSKLARLVLKLAERAKLGPPEEDGYIPNRAS